MKLIKPSFEIIEQLPGLEGVYKQIELAGRTCYKSHDKITEDSAKEFVDRMIKSGHGAMLEHGTVYLHMEFASKEAYFNDELALKYHNESHTKTFRVRDVATDPKGKQHAYITTNLRVLVENDWMEDLQYICEPTEYHEKRYTVKFITDQGILREFTRHRVQSFAVESTRYCNYSKNKFNNEITYILPPWMDEAQLGTHDPKEIIKQANGFNEWANDEDISEIVFLLSLARAEEAYLGLINIGWQPQQARNVLPLATKCEMIMTGFASDWNHFCSLRCPSSAHPQARELAIPLMEEFKNKGYVI